MDKIYRAIEAMHSAKRHFGIGTNCYQRAIGYEPVLIAVGPLDLFEAMQLFDYITIAPGYAGREFAKVTQPLKKEDVQKIILTGCQEEGLVDLPEIVEEKEGYSLIALYFADHLSPGGVDFHFIRKDDDGKWRSKVPYEDIIVYDEPPKEIDNYHFDRLLLAPKNITPKAIEDLAPQIITMPSEIGDIQFGYVTKAKGPYSGKRIVADFNRNLTINPDTGAVTPLPYYAQPLFSPPRPKPYFPFKERLFESEFEPIKFSKKIALG